MTDILNTGLEAIDADCESAVKIEVDALYDNAYHDGAKFHIPSPQAAESIWLKLIARKEREFIQEIEQVLKPRSAILSRETAFDIEKTIEATFADDRYLERMRDFYQKIAQKALLYEPSFDLPDKRLDLLDSTYRAGVTDALRKARRNTLAKLESYKPLDTSGGADFFSQLRQYSSLSPWRSIVTIVLLSLTSYLIAFIIASETFREFLERFGWSVGTGL